MPIYEYRCQGCKRRVSIFFPSFSAAESRIAAGEAKCPRCGSAELSRLMSRVYTARAEGGDDDDFEDFGAGSEDMFDGLNEDDPRALARWARQMKDSMGDDADLGPEFDRALERIEAGEDPERVMDEIDPDSIGMGGGEDEALDDLSGDPDF